jgi:hypothetical protein
MNPFIYGEEVEGEKIFINDIFFKHWLRTRMNP